MYRRPTRAWDDAPLVHEAAADLICTYGDEAASRAARLAEIAAGRRDRLSWEAWLDISNT
jgi:hypothetical protein